MITVEENGIGGFGSHGGPSTQPASHLSTPLADALHAADQAPAITMMAESLCSLKLPALQGISAGTAVSCLSCCIDQQYRDSASAAIM